MNVTGIERVSSAETVPSLYYQFDCALRNESDATRRLQLGLRMGMEREGAEPAAKARQDRLMRPRYRVAANREVVS